MSKKYKRFRHCPKPSKPIAHFPSWLDDKEYVQREYGKCWILEKDLEKKYRKKIKGISPKNIAECQKIVDEILRKLFVHKKVKIVEVETGVCYYQNSTICLVWKNLSTLLHELAHHIVRVEKGLSGRHHGDFLWVLETVWEAFLENK